MTLDENDQATNSVDSNFEGLQEAIINLKNQGKEGNDDKEWNPTIYSANDEEDEGDEGDEGDGQ